MAEALRLDRANACLWQQAVAIPLTPKAMAVVEYLVAHAGAIATKDALLSSVWANESVSEYALTSIIRDLRRALGDSTKNPRYIQTVHRRGYRWIGQVLDVTETVAGEPVPAESTATTPEQKQNADPKNPFFAGRGQELETLQGHLQLAAIGKRQLVFLTGEAGIGKTTLLERFSDQVANRPDCSVAWGQCIEKYGMGEAYHPVLEALNRFCLTTKGEKYIGTIEQYAPSWLMQMPPLLTPAQLLRLQQKGAAPKSRWLRELAEALEMITQAHLLVLILEDLHWGDPPTVELLDMLARRQEAAKLLVVASYRGAEVSGSNHPLKPAKQELQFHNLCQEIALGSLNQQDIEAYLLQRFSSQFSPSQPPQCADGPSASQDTLSAIASKLYQRTEGSPLFVVNVIESSIEKHPNQPGEEFISPPELLSNTIPSNLKQLIDLQFDALDNGKQKILEAASVEGAEFLSVTVAASLNLESERVELCLDDLIQLNHLIAIDDVEILPDGTLSTRYRFIHALYQEGLYQRIAQNRRVRLHRAIGAQLEAIYDDQASKIASQLALHFEQGMAYPKAIRYRQQAGENALRRSAHDAAVEHFHQALELLPRVTRAAVREPLELGIQTLLGSALMTLKGQAAPEVGNAYTRARQLCPRTSPEQFDVTLGLWRHRFIAGDLDRSLELSDRCFTLATQLKAPALRGSAHYALAGTLMYRGDLAQALAHAEAGLADYRGLREGHDAALRHSQDPSATLMAYRAWILFFMGYWEQAVKGMNDALELEIVRSHPQTSVTSLTYSGILYLYLRELDLAQQQLEKAVQMAQRWHITQFATIAKFFLTYTLSSKCRLAPSSRSLHEMKTTLASRRAAGADLHATGYLNRLAEGYLSAGQPETSLALLAESNALADQSNERLFAADTYRLMGEFLLSQDNQHQMKAETLFKKSLVVAKQQESTTFELRAATCLAELWNSQGKVSEAKALLAPVYEKFTEGFEFPDLKKAQKLTRMM